MKYCIYGLFEKGELIYVGSSRGGLRGSFRTRKRIGGEARVLRVVEDPRALSGCLTVEIARGLAVDAKLRNSKSMQALASKLWLGEKPNKFRVMIKNLDSIDRQMASLKIEDPFSFGA